MNGVDGWVLLFDFLQKVVTTLDSHPSTLGYEILSEPQVHSSDQWEKIGSFNSLMVNELRKITQKTLAYSMNIPVDLKSPIGLNPTNLAKMAPANKTNVVFKISLYGLPKPDFYQGNKLAIFLRTSKLHKCPCTLVNGIMYCVKHLSRRELKEQLIIELATKSNVALSIVISHVIIRSIIMNE